MPANDAVPGGDEAAKAPMERHRSILGANTSRQTKRILTDDIGRLRVINENGDSLAVSVLATGTVSGLADATLSTITTFVAASNTFITKVSCSGDGPADFTLVLNTIIIDTQRSSTGDLDKSFMFEQPLELTLNDTLSVKVEHCAVGKTKTFNATIYGA